MLHARKRVLADIYQLLGLEHLIVRICHAHEHVLLRGGQLGPAYLPEGLGRTVCGERSSSGIEGLREHESGLELFKGLKKERSAVRRKRLVVPGVSRVRGQVGEDIGTRLVDRTVRLHNPFLGNFDVLVGPERRCVSVLQGIQLLTAKRNCAMQRQEKRDGHDP